MFNKINILLIGMVQNMSHFICPNCKHESHIFKNKGAEKSGIGKQFESVKLYTFE